MDKLLHLLIPRESNNHKAKILHPNSLLIVTMLFLFFQVFVSNLPKLKPDILGYAANIAPDEVVRLTNQKRQEAGLSLLTYNSDLAGAAYTKGVDMITKDYWAHVAPDGTQPWKFFNDFGYKYKYAGENLARDFTNPSSAVDAWMNSPTHRENILNPKYKEIGIGVVEGDLAGTDTTIIVQFFGSTYSDKVVLPVAQAAQTEKKVIATEAPKIVATPLAVEVRAPEVNTIVTTESQQVLISPFSTTKNVSLIVVGILLLIFVIDAVLVSKRRITRVAGRTFSHVAFLGMIVVIVLILKSGEIL